MDRTLEKNIVCLIRPHNTVDSEMHYVTHIYIYIYIYIYNHVSGITTTLGH